MSVAKKPTACAFWTMVASWNVFSRAICGSLTLWRKTETESTTTRLAPSACTRSRIMRRCASTMMSGWGMNTISTIPRSISPSRSQPKPRAVARSRSSVSSKEKTIPFSPAWAPR